MKPTRTQVVDAYLAASRSVYPTAAGIDAIMEVIDRAWETQETMANEALAYAKHDTGCGWWDRNGGRECSCGLSAVLLKHPRAEVDEAVGILSEARLGDGWERLNDDQRKRRAAYEEGARAHAPQPGEAGPEFNAWLRSIREAAARRYPLRKRVSKVVPDPHGGGMNWRLNPDFARLGPCAEIQFREGGEWFANDHSALLDDPWTYEESTEVEE